MGMFFHCQLSQLENIDFFPDRNHKKINMEINGMSAKLHSRLNEEFVKLFLSIIKSNKCK